MLLQNLIEGVDVTCADPRHLEQRICDLTEDSRTVLPGSLFIARSGTRSRGTDFIDDAIDAGAAAILIDAIDADQVRLPDDVALLTTPDINLATALLAERFFGAPSSRLTLVGVTGTNGKTTIAHLVHQFLNAGGMRCGLIGTVTIDDGLEVAPASMTTPPAIEISHALSNMIEGGCVAAALEVSSHALDQCRAAALRFDVAIFTNISGDHQDYHKSMEHYIASKARLFTSLSPEALAIVNVDDPCWQQMVRDCRARTLTCSMNPQVKADCCATIRQETVLGVDVELKGPWGVMEAVLPLIGRHNAMNALQALAAAHACGVPRPDLRRTLSRVRPAPGRLEIVTREPGVHEDFVVLVDYAHTDHALEAALLALLPLKPSVKSRLRLVFGCGGDRDRTKRPRMMRIAALHADDVIVTNDNPRTESPAAIFRDILAGLPETDSAKVTIQPDRRRAIYDAVMAAREGDIVLIAGKGHEDYQLLPDRKGGWISTPFDDRTVAREALQTRFAHEHAVASSQAGSSGEEAPG